MTAKIASGESLFFPIDQDKSSERFVISDASNDTVTPLMQLEPIEKAVLLSVLYTNLVVGTGLRLLLLRVIKSKVGFLCISSSK